MWLKRHWQIAIACGLGLGALGQVAVAMLARSELDTSLGQRSAALLYSSACVLCIGLGLGLATARLLGKRAGRITAIALSATVMSLLAVTLMVGVACRIVSGSYLTAGAVMFAFNGRDNFLHAAAAGYLRWVATGAGVSVVLAVGLVRALRPAAAPVARLPRRDAAIALGLLLVVGGLYWRREDSSFTRGMFVSAPLLALVSSFDPDFEVHPGVVNDEANALRGPLRASETDWLAIAHASGPACRASASAKRCARPNVLLFILESIAPAHLSRFGYARPTPEIDRLTREGLFMRRAWTTATHSNYAQPAILSSLFPRRGRGLDQYEDLNYPRFLFHDAFHTLGYDTATISSQDEKWQGMRRFQDTGTPTFYWFSDDYPGAGLDSGVERIAPDDATADKALEWLARPREKPWALYVNFQATHFPYTLGPGTPRPYQPDEPDWSTFTYLRYPESDREVVINRYDNALAQVDRQIGRIRRALEQSGELDSTLIVLTADHGELFFDRGMVTHGRTLYDIESRVPLALRWPGHVPVAERDEPVSHIDILPTLADLLGLPPHPSWQGLSFLDPHPERAGKRGIFLNIQGLRFADAVVCWPYKMMIDRTGKTPHLFDLARDPGEQSDLVDSEPVIAGRLSTVLQDEMIAQLEYHHDDSAALRRERFAPRLRPCPLLPPR